VTVDKLFDGSDAHLLPNMKRTPWYPGTTYPVRGGWYERDYSNVLEVTGTVIMDLWQQIRPGSGYWYVEEPRGQINDAFYENLPWRGVAK
jgi:hypothetical protein